MQTLAQSPASLYRKVDLDARIEASQSSDLTRICLEEVIAALGQVLVRLEQDPAGVPRDALSRAHGIALWLMRTIAPENLLRDQLTQFYGGLEKTLRDNLVQPRFGEIRQARQDYKDLLQAAISAG
ncbi:MAG: hypothetical protein AAGK17_10780 [Pseudomonadota bacterium]